MPELSGDHRGDTASGKGQSQGAGFEGNRVEFEAAGLLGRAVQHETDHLNGILFIDRMSSAAKASLAGKLKRLAAESKE